MRQASPVGVVCRGRGWRLTQAALFGLAAFAFTAWLLQRAGVFAPLPVFGGSALVAAGVAGSAWRWLSAPPLRLAWDGAQWLAGDETATVNLQIDFGRALLFRVEAPTFGRRWLLTSRAEAGAAWHALRVAAHAREASKG